METPWSGVAVAALMAVGSFIYYLLSRRRTNPEPKCAGKSVWRYHYKRKQNIFLKTLKSKVAFSRLSVIKNLVVNLSRIRGV